VVVVTPVRNEAWILSRFLSVTSHFADHIIIADQESTDESISICQRFPKVTLIHNKSNEYDEAARQALLIQTARELVPEHKIILALDADEVLAANALDTPGWKQMFEARPGTILCFEKPELYLTTSRCIRYERPWPIGYVDDGVEHRPTKIHSIRIPTPQSSPKLHVADVKVLHYGLVRDGAQNSKQRMYCVIEHVLRASPFWRRRLAYRSGMDWSTLGRLESSRPDWFEGWERLGIDMHTIPPQVYHWQDYEVLRYFAKYGTRRFWVDDIWNFDWEKCRTYARSINVAGMPDARITSPPGIIKPPLALLDMCLIALRAIYRALKRKLVPLSGVRDH